MVIVLLTQGCQPRMAHPGYHGCCQGLIIQFQFPEPSVPEREVHNGSQMLTWFRSLFRLSVCTQELAGLPSASADRPGRLLASSSYTWDRTISCVHMHKNLLRRPARKQFTSTLGCGVEIVGLCAPVAPQDCAPFQTLPRNDGQNGGINTAALRKRMNERARYPSVSALTRWSYLGIPGHANQV
jgi:hypothetical protein